MSKIINDVDVICEMKPSGDVIPMKFRIQNEDGEYETYIVKAIDRYLGRIRIRHRMELLYQLMI